jgi:rod shape-determining protein MreC|tara:strand:+ start:657 stop:1505 length:849 start_codon:yes stop_codon:yes gene_type:complete
MVARKPTKNLKLFVDTNVSIPLFSLLIIFCFILMGIDSRYSLTKNIRKDFAIFTAPIYSLINAPNKIYKSNLKNFTDKKILVEENEILKKELYASELINQTNNTLESENKILRQKLNLKKNYFFKNVDSEIIRPSTKVNKKIITINKGQIDNVKEGSAVINNYGLIGQIYNVFDDSSEVTSLISDKFGVPAMLENGLQNTILYGDGQQLIIPFSSIHNNINVGDIYVTSGLDEIYPKGIKIGTVSAILRTSDNQFVKIIVNPFTRPETSSQVTIISPDGRRK